MDIALRKMKAPVLLALRLTARRLFSLLLFCFFLVALFGRLPYLFVPVPGQQELSALYERTHRLCREISSQARPGEI